MYNDLDKKFDRITKKAIPYLVLAPPNFRTEVAELMEALFHQLLQRSDSDFDIHYSQLNEMLDNRNSFESGLEDRVWKFATMFVPQETTVFQMSQKLVKLESRATKSERKIKSLENLVKTKPNMDNHTSPKENHTSPKENVVKMFGECVCDICGTTLKNKGTRYYPSHDATFHKGWCPNCDLWFIIDDKDNILPTKRTKKILERIERLKAEQQRTRPKPGTPSAPV
jgi:hypothetical protein